MSQDRTTPGARPAPGAFAPANASTRIEQWQRRNEVLDAQLAEMERRAYATREAMATAVGIAAGNRKAVQAAVDANNRLLDLLIEPEALRLGSIEALRNEVFEAVVNAQADVAAKIAAAAGDLTMSDMPGYGAVPELADVITRDVPPPGTALGDEHRGMGR